MVLSMNWLSDFVKADDIEIKEYCDAMTESGSKVEGYEILGEDIVNVVVAKIEKITPHENSDHLQVCQMNVGKDELTQIVTGAQNVFEGAIVPAAVPVAHLPGDVTIKAYEAQNESLRESKAGFQASISRPHPARDCNAPHRPEKKDGRTPS